MACGISFQSSASGTLVPNIITPAVGENPNTPPKSHKFFLSNVRSSGVFSASTLTMILT